MENSIKQETLNFHKKQLEAKLITLDLGLSEYAIADLLNVKEKEVTNINEYESVYESNRMHEINIETLGAFQHTMTKMEVDVTCSIAYFQNGYYAIVIRLAYRYEHISGSNGYTVSFHQNRKRNLDAGRSPFAWVKYAY